MSTPTAYIQNWIEKLEEDNRLIVHAAAKTPGMPLDAAVSGIPAAVAMNIAPADYGHAHL
jgi:antirestriction protein ArdC